MRRTGARRDGAHRGQSLVELAMLAPLLAVLLLGALDLGRVFFAYVQLTNGVEAGATFGTLRPRYVTATSVPASYDTHDNIIFAGSTDPTNIIYRVQNEGSPNLTDVTVTCYVGSDLTQLRTGPAGTTPGDCSAVNTDGSAVVQSGDTIVVSASYPFQPLTIWMKALLGAPFVMHKTARMVIL